MDMPESGTGSFAVDDDFVDRAFCLLGLGVNDTSGGGKAEKTCEQNANPKSDQASHEVQIIRRLMVCGPLQRGPQTPSIKSLRDDAMRTYQTPFSKR